MNDRLLLIVAALASSLAAWAFWHYMGQDALDMLVLVALVCAVADNWRLRRALRRVLRRLRESNDQLRANDSKE